MRTQLSALALLVSTGSLVAGCGPNDGTVSGDYLVFLGERGANIEDLKARKVPINSDDADKRAQAYDTFGLTPIDCRELEDESARLPDADYSACLDTNGDPRGTHWYYWLDDYAYYKKEGRIEPYRVEAVITSEGDLQLTVHMDVARFGDFRFGWVIDPDFQPVDCVDDEAGGSELVQIDGNWVEAWSEGSDGTLFHLNAFSYQLNPANHEDYWTIDQEWMAGYSFGRFAEEPFSGHSTDYLDGEGWPIYLLDYNRDTFLGGYGSEEDFPWHLPFAGTNDTYDSWFDEVIGPEGLGEEAHDLATLGQSEFPHEFRFEHNGWRISAEEEDDELSENYAYGLENWIGVSSSWVSLELTPAEVAALEPGSLEKPLKGSFQIHGEYPDSTSKLFVKGEFSIDHLRKDVWGFSPTLDEQKREENNTPECGDYRLTTDG